MEQFRNILHQILQGLAFLHSEGIIHCDISPRSILIDQKGIAKITSFGSSVDKKMITSNGSQLPEFSTSLPLPPDMIGDSIPTEFYDIWSFGVTLGIVLFPNWSLLFGGSHRVVLPDVVYAGTTSEIHREAINVMHKILRIKDVTAPRPSAYEIMNQSLFSKSQGNSPERSELDEQQKMEWFRSYMRQFREMQMEYDDDDADDDDSDDSDDDKIQLHDIDRKDLIRDVVRMVDGKNFIIS